jgi:ABC-type transport system involved in Fe-S cluster assembly fused permease/ATPase subunit
MRNITAIFCLTLTILLGSVGVSLGHEGLDGEYLRAIKTMGGSGINWIDAIFRYCVVLLVDLAKVLGISYEELNIWVFIIIQPLIIVFLFLWVLLLKRRIKKNDE